jgi:selenocysteine lyase/cysteine desulfurase
MMQITPGEAIRHLFPICDDTTYLASSSCAALGKPVQQAVVKFLHTWREYGPQWEDTWYEAVILAERLFASLYGVDEREIVLLPNVTSALASLASAFHPGSLAEFGNRTQVLLPTGEFPTTGHLWGKQPGLKVVAFPANQDDLTPYLTRHTLLVVLSHVCYSTGRRRDLWTIIEQAHAAGALVLVDDSQSSGTRSLDALALGIDLLVASGHKYLLGLPGGNAFLYVRTGLLERLHPTMTGWAAHQDFVRTIVAHNGHLQIRPGQQGWNPLAFEEAEDAWRFAGGTANVLGAAAASAGLRLLAEVGLKAIEQHTTELAARFLTGCADLGLTLKTPLSASQRGPMVVLKTPEPGSLAAAFAEQHILASPRGDGLRFAFHLYNTGHDVERALDALAVCRSLVATPWA